MNSRFLTIVFSFILAVASHAQTVFTLNKTTFAPGESIIATWSGRTSPGTKDWVAVYPRPIAGDPNGVPDGNPGSTIWKYTSGTQTAGAALAAGSVTFTNPGLAAGNWTAYFLANDGYTRLGSVQFSVINAAKIAGFTADHAFINDGTPITLSWVIDPGTQSLQTLTLNDGTTDTDVTALNLLEVSPTQNTVYKLTLNGAATAQATVFTDAGNTTAFNLGTSTHFSSAEDFVVNWNGTVGAPDSWVGIYRVGGQPGPTLAAYWNYLNGTRTPGGANQPNGSLGFDPAPGDYYAVLFSNSGYTIEQGPIRFTVTEKAILPFAVTSFGEDGGDFRIDWNSLPGETYDVMTSTDLTNWEPAVENIRAAKWDSRVFVPTTPEDTKRFFSIRRRK